MNLALSEGNTSVQSKTFGNYSSDFATDGNSETCAIIERLVNFLDPKDLRNWLCHSVTPSLRPSLTDVFKTENHCLALDNF